MDKLLIYPKQYVPIPPGARVVEINDQGWRILNGFGGVASPANPRGAIIAYTGVGLRPLDLYQVGTRLYRGQSTVHGLLLPPSRITNRLLPKTFRRSDTVYDGRCVLATGEGARAIELWFDNEVEMLRSSQQRLHTAIP